MPDMSASANLALTHLVPLAKEVDDNKVTPGVLGFIVFAALAAGVWFLMKSMNRHMGRVNFEEAPDPSGEASPKDGKSESPAAAGG
ncbi:hypothetical protein HRW23_03740 [Streptomyces lunaelactis]|uniref:hypothetical protein n=1 Tax=Streptomyces lunaelactis TaxID=1535768 RepID=UPI0015848A45|nr:hypothetical protein [Streptomyces lunaelactis]NUK03671.1 hypothetical protein [Streptomyces lunaelactis]NUK09769.1 hypothetical protein [Streptomyces lunaelactis]NUK17269.1 hypothetical protein [Streptomyces lunaelactis]NUK24419.1 hypothetical protein [Streptomyces lunaelactis]NUK36959.1 hypothetical protein [Streptomyces lunaelactis]